MKANAPERIWIDPATDLPKLSGHIDSVEYIRKDAFIEKACEFLYNYNKKQVLKHGAMATLGCGEYTINVDEFRKYMKGE